MLENGNFVFSSKELALMAYDTEVIEQDSSGGKMDQFTISIGDTIYLDTNSDRIHKFENLPLSLVVGVSVYLKIHLVHLPT